MSDHRRPAFLLASVLAVVLVACSGASASTPPSSGPADSSGDPSSAEPSPAGAVPHPTGASDIVLRYEEAGGFVMPAFLAAYAPHFTLYGDGTIVFRDPMQTPPPAQGSAFVMPPMQIAKLSEEQIQELLVFALGEGGLAAARPEYLDQMISDASTAVFTLDTGDLQKTVSVYALGLGDSAQAGPDAAARTAFKRLADRLVGLGSGGAVTTAQYVPTAYRVTLLESPGVAAPDIVAWPWDDVAIDDFKPSGEPNGLQFPQLTMTPEQVAELGVTDFEGGYQNLVITGPSNGMTYTVAVRPLLPDESD